MFKPLRAFSNMLSKINKFLGWILSPYKISTGNASVEKHPKINRVYEKGAGARFLLFLVSLLCVGGCLAVEFFIYYAIFSGNYLLIIVFIPIILLLRYPTNFCSGLSGIAFCHFRVRVKKKIKEDKKQTEKPKNLALEEKPETIVESPENLENNEQRQTESVAETAVQEEQPAKQKKVKIQRTEDTLNTTKTRAFSSLVICIVEAIFTVVIPLALFVIPFSSPLWFK